MSTAKWSIITFLSLVLILPITAKCETLTVAGTGSSTPLIQLLFDEFSKDSSDAELRIIDPPLGSNGALKALSLGRVDLAIVGRPLALEEYSKFGKHFTLADTPFIMASRDGERKDGFTLDQLAEVYEGSLRNWDFGGPIRLIIRGSFESDTLLLKTFSPRLAAAVDVASKRPGMAGAVNDLDTAKLIVTTSGSLGPTTLGLLTSMGLHATAYPLNGVMPTIANLENQTYPWSKTLEVVLPQRPSATAKAFAAFLHTPSAKVVMLRNDYLPAKK